MLFFLLMGQLFLFCFDLRHRFADDRCFLAELPYIYMVLYLHKYSIFRNSIRIKVKMSEKSLMVESKEDEAERLHFQKVTILQVVNSEYRVPFINILPVQFLRSS